MFTVEDMWLDMWKWISGRGVGEWRQLQALLTFTPLVTRKWCVATLLRDPKFCQLARTAVEEREQCLGGFGGLKCGPNAESQSESKARGKRQG